MSSEVETMMYAAAGGEPWHGLGVAVKGATTSEEAIKAAGLGWAVALDKMYLGDGSELPKHRAVVRDVDGRVLGVVGKGWQPLQNAEAFKWFDPMIASGEATYEAAGSLRDGSRVWILAKINRPDLVIVDKADDRVSRYVLLSNGHDGSLAVRAGFTPVRVVCQNTLSMAHGDGASKLIRMRHTSGLTETLDKVREVMDLADQEFVATAAQYRRLASRALHRGDLEKYVKKVFQIRERSHDASDDGAGEEKGGPGSRLVETVSELFNTGTGNDMPGVAGTWWAAYNAATHYLTHGRGSDAATRLDQLWHGGGAATNTRALQHAYVMASA